MRLTYESFHYSHQSPLTFALVFQILPSLAQEMQQQDKQKQDDEPVKLRATLVQVPVIVKDEGERYLTDLKKEDFKLYENGRLQEITFFGTTEIPFQVALLIDSSGSTTEQLSQIKASALAFVDNLRPADKVMVVEFNDSVSILCELTNNKRKPCETPSPAFNPENIHRFTKRSTLPYGNDSRMLKDAKPLSSSAMSLTTPVLKLMRKIRWQRSPKAKM